DVVGIDADEPAGGADAASLVEVLEHGEGLVVGEMTVEQGRPLPLGEAALAGVAVEQADVIPFAVAGADREGADATPRVEGAARVLAAEAREVIHAVGRSGQRGAEIGG